MREFSHMYPIALVHRVLQMEPAKRILPFKKCDCHNNPFFHGTSLPENALFMQAVLINESMTFNSGYFSFLQNS